MEDRPQLSITLPRNFMFHYRDGQPPRTPEPEPQTEELLPPPPPRQTLKVRRRRRTTFVPTHDMSEFHDAADDMPIPTIEGPELHPDAAADLPTQPAAIDSEYLSPVLAWGRMLSPPKTPIAQMGSLSAFDTLQRWSEDYHDSFTRPTSSAGFSDSSVSTVESFESLPSLGGSCTSPEEDMAEPFVFCSPAPKYTPVLSSPLATQKLQPKKLKLRATFTEEMDRHLWMTYMTYLQDPTVTPFKALPSTVPPNGVCHRVARLARRTWKGGPSATLVPGARTASHAAPHHDTPGTIKPAKSGSNTPVAVTSKPYARYPAEKNVRRRLRYLARAKPTLSAHYQRLLRRSPSLLQSSPPPPATTETVVEPIAETAAQTTTQPPPILSSPFSQETFNFSIRDMNVSLTTSTAPSMQMGNPLSQLANDDTPRPADTAKAQSRASAHQKSQSLHIGLGLTWGDALLSAEQEFLENERQKDRMNEQANQTWHPRATLGPSLGSPVQLHAPRPISRAFRRRALHNFEEQSRNRGNSFITQVFGAPAESSHRRVRSRGFSLGDMVDGARRLPLSTSGPPAFNPFASPPMSEQCSSSVSPEMHGQATVRLGSPFEEGRLNTFPRASTSHGFEPPASFEQRFAAFPSNAANASRY